MKLKVLMAIIIAAVASLNHAYAQPKGVKQSYNFSRALEEVGKGNNVDALDFLNKEVKENPNNGYAFMTMAIMVL